MILLFFLFSDRAEQTVIFPQHVVISFISVYSWTTAPHPLSVQNNLIPLKKMLLTELIIKEYEQKIKHYFFMNKTNMHPVLPGVLKPLMFVIICVLSQTDGMLKFSKC